MRQSHVVLCVLTFLLTRTCFAQPALTGFVLINGGTFHSGDVVTNSHRGRVRVEDFEILDHPVTNREYKKFVDATGYRAPLHWIDGKIPAGRDDYPVIFVNITDADKYVRWLSKTDGRVYRLPTGVEFEYAARGGVNDKMYPWEMMSRQAEQISMLMGIGDSIDGRIISSRSRAERQTATDSMIWPAMFGS
jgi:formylglycine-generating enzyme required for sulfatase activity